MCLKVRFSLKRLPSAAEHGGTESSLSHDIQPLWQAEVILEIDSSPLYPVE